MSYSCLVGSFLNSTTATRPDPTRLVCDLTKKSVHVEIEPTRSATQKKPEKSAIRPDKSATRPDFVGDPSLRPGSPTKSGRVAAVGFSLNPALVSARRLGRTVTHKLQVADILLRTGRLV